MSQRPDWDVIIDLIPAGTRILELGCGDGSLLAQFLAHKAIFARGVEKNEENVRACVANGFSVRHGDIEEGLADFANQAFEYVILSQTLGCLQNPIPVLREMLRVARFGIVSFQNAGYWQDRFHVLAGRGAGNPLKSGLPLTRSITVFQFLDALTDLGLVVDRCIFLSGNRRVLVWPTLRAQTAVFMITATTFPGNWADQIAKDKQTAELGQRLRN